MMNVDDIRAKAAKVANFLEGTCGTLEAAVEEFFPDEQLLNNNFFCETFDNMISCCEQCGWWVETCDTDDDGNCSDCVSSEDD